MSVEDYAALRQARKLPIHISEMPAQKVARIASARMDPRHDDLDALMDE